MDKRRFTCCFTGHRNLPMARKSIIESRTEQAIRDVIDKGVIYFGVGGALGYDTLAAEILFRLKEQEFPNIKISLVYPFDGFTDRWNEVDQRKYQRMLKKYDKVVRVSEHPSKGAYLQRDRHMVDVSGYCICYLSESSGGTAYTVDYAKKKGLVIYNTNPGF